MAQSPQPAAPVRQERWLELHRRAAQGDELARAEITAEIRRQARDAAAESSFTDFGATRDKVIPRRSKCLRCGRPFTPGRRTDAEYCSRLCVKKAWEERQRPAREVITCGHCGASLEAYRRSARYCSENCRIAAWKRRAAG